MSDDLRSRMAERLGGFPALETGDCYMLADSLLPLVYGFAAEVLRAAAQEQRNEADQVPWDDQGTHADGHRCAADFLDRRAKVLERDT